MLIRLVVNPSGNPFTASYLEALQLQFRRQGYRTLRAMDWGTQPGITRTGVASLKCQDWGTLPRAARPEVPGLESRGAGTAPRTAAAVMPRRA